MTVVAEVSVADKGVPIRSLSRGIAVLQAVNRGSSLSITEIARLSEVPYPTACRIVQTLLYEGLIEREPARKRYRPTSLTQTLAYGFRGDMHLIEVARPHLVELTRSFGWPVSISTHVGASMVIRDSTHSLTALTFNNYYPGYALPVLECASGLVYISHMDTEERRNLLRTLKLMDNGRLRHTIALLDKEGMALEIRTSGYATRGKNLFTNNPGKTSSIAVPILREGEIIAALTLAFFSAATRMDDAVRQFVAPLARAAGAIGQDLILSSAA